MMNTKILKHCTKIILIAVLINLWSCSDSWLEPKPLSFYTPENTFIDAAGMYSALTAAERNLRHEFFGDAAPILTEFIFSDMAVDGTTNRPGAPVDLDIALLPDAPRLNHQDGTRIEWYWNEQYRGIRYANVVISRIDHATYKSDAERNAVLGAAFFQRAYRYWGLVHQFGDVPFLDVEIVSPKLDFYSHDRWSILERLKIDLEFAYEWVPENVDRGKTSNAACGMLLMKVCMALCDFDRAIQIGNEIVSKHPLMTKRFSAAQTKPNTNLMHDLHSIEAKQDWSNTEGLMYVISDPEGGEGSATIQTMRNGVPGWDLESAWSVPNGPKGMSVSLAPGEQPFGPLDINRNYGRGIGRLRPSHYYTNTIWTEKESRDLRGIYNRDSWRSPEDMKYNAKSIRDHSNPAIKEWYGKNVVYPVSMSIEDSIRTWFSWPHYKLYVPQPRAGSGNWNGGETPWYIYRSAEVYLMIAECYYWKDLTQQSAEILNIVRSRSGAEPLSASEINIGSILDERARELYYEEKRKTELTRIAYTFAKLKKPCSVFNNVVYKLENFSGPGGVNSNIKQEGINFYYDWVMHKNNFYNKGVALFWAEYKMSVHHVLWPIPATAITTNTLGVINQNIGYPGVENNLKPLIAE